MPQNDYTSLTTPQLHTANERNRRKWNRADAATRNSNAVGDGFGVVSLEPDDLLLLEMHKLTNIIGNHS